MGIFKVSKYQSLKIIIFRVWIQQTLFQKTEKIKIISLDNFFARSKCQCRLNFKDQYRIFKIPRSTYPITLNDFYISQEFQDIVFKLSEYKKPLNQKITYKKIRYHKIKINQRKTLVFTKDTYWIILDLILTMQ